MGAIDEKDICSTLFKRTCSIELYHGRWSYYYDYSITV